MSLDSTHTITSSDAPSDLAKLNLPLLIEAEQLLPILAHPLLRLVDLSKPQVYEQVHLPNAVSVAPKMLLRQQEYATGLLPDSEQLQQLIQRLDITQQHHIVVYDDEGGAWAGRLIWTLHILGFTQVSLLNGGIHYWLAQGYPISNEAFKPEQSVPEAGISNLSTNEPSTNKPSINRPSINESSNNHSSASLNLQNRVSLAELQTILAKQHDVYNLWDCRSFEEYTGARLAAKRGGHLPAALHLEWDSLFNRQDYLRLKPLTLIHHLLAARGLNFDKPVIVYCQSHHRSGLAYVVAKLLNLDVRAYDGAWSEWGNQPNTPNSPIVTGENPF